jgi:hypothetical protein
LGDPGSLALITVFVPDVKSVLAFNNRAGL